MANRELRIGNLKRPDWVWSVMMWRSWAGSVGQRDGFPTKHATLACLKSPARRHEAKYSPPPLPKGADSRSSRLTRGRIGNYGLRILNCELIRTQIPSPTIYHDCGLSIILTNLPMISTRMARYSFIIVRQRRMQFTRQKVKDKIPNRFRRGKHLLRSLP